jgi:acyl dehydratase
MKFAEIEAGQRFTLGPVRVAQEEVIAFAASYDDQWFHTDPEAAAQGPFQGLIASGWHTCALAMRLVSRHILKGSESFASPGLSYVRWPHPVRPDDELTLEILVHESRVSASRPTLGVLRWQWLMRNQDGALVLDLEATSMFRLVAAATRE